MKNFTFIFTFLLVLLVSVSCEEQIAEELKSVNTSATAGPTDIVAGTGMSITNTMDSAFSHFIHKEGNSNEDCMLVAPVTGWEADEYTKDNSLVVPDVVADCVLEVEELDLFTQGAKLELKVDNGVCEYVTYEPFRFFQYQLGISDMVQYEVACDDICGAMNPGLCATYSTGLFKTYSEVSSFTGEQDFYDDSSVSPQACKFDYSDNGQDGPNCDEGQITTKGYELRGYDQVWCHNGSYGELLPPQYTAGNCSNAGIWDATDADGDGFLCDITERISESTCTTAGLQEQLRCDTGGGASYFQVEEELEECGGNAIACTNGQSKEVFGDEEANILLMNNENLSEFTYEAVIDSADQLGYATNIYAASYSRVLVNNLVKAPFTGGINAFLGYEIEKLAPFTAYNGKSIDSDNNGRDDYTILSDHPFKGAWSDGGISRLYTRPYYKFNCLDKARDVKAQIRVHIREWDRSFTKSFSFLNLISDFGLTGLLRFMDNNSLQDGDEPWNDRADWDDFFVGSTDVFVSGDPDSLTNPPGAGACIDIIDEVTVLIPDNKADCLALLQPKCSNGINVTKASCEGAGENWMDTPWISNEQSSLNFPGSSL